MIEKMIRDLLASPLGGSVIRKSGRFDVITQRGTIRLSLGGHGDGPFTLEVSINNSWSKLCMDYREFHVKQVKPNTFSLYWNPSSGWFRLVGVSDLGLLLEMMAEYLSRVLPIDTPEPPSHAEQLWSVTGGGGEAKLHLPTFRDHMRSELASEFGRNPLMEDVYRYVASRFNLDLQGVREERSYKNHVVHWMTDLAWAWLGTKSSTASSDHCFALAYDIGVLTTGDVYPPLPAEPWNGISPLVKQEVDRFPRAKSSPKRTLAAIEAIVKVAIRPEQ